MKYFHLNRIQESFNICLTYDFEWTFFNNVSLNFVFIFDAAFKLCLFVTAIEPKMLLKFMMHISRSLLLSDKISAKLHMTLIPIWFNQKLNTCNENRLTCKRQKIWLEYPLVSKVKKRNVVLVPHIRCHDTNGLIYVDRIW